MTQLQEPSSRFGGIISLGRFSTYGTFNLFGRWRGRAPIQTVPDKVEEPAFIDGVVRRGRERPGSRGGVVSPAVLRRTP